MREEVLKGRYHNFAGITPELIEMVHALFDLICETDRPPKCAMIKQSLDTEGVLTYHFYHEK